MKNNRFNKVYQFKITLKGSEPPIWRCIQVPQTYTFWGLHVAIQNAMDWRNYHLHEFDVKNPVSKQNVRIGLPNIDYPEDFVPDWELKISDFFTEDYPVGYYIYDFGDGWIHIIVLEEILERVEDLDYPRCIDGRMACPPEDCGGIAGYAELIRALKSPKHRRHKELTEWVGGEFDPEHFDPQEVRFQDPDKLLKNLHR